MDPEIVAQLPLFTAVAVLSCLFGALVAYVAGPVRTDVVYVDRVPPALSRLARLFGITEDLPEGDSYGRKLHDLFEARDSEILDLRARCLDLEEQLDQKRDYLPLLQRAEERIANQREELRSLNQRLKGSLSPEDVQEVVARMVGEAVAKAERAALLDEAKEQQERIQDRLDGTLWSYSSTSWNC